MATTRLRTLGNDADFEALYRSVSNIGAAILRAGSKLTTEDKQARVANLQSGDAARARAALNVLGASERVVEEQRRLLRLVVNRHDLPLDATLPGTFGDAAVAAKWSYDEEHGGGPAPDPLDELEDELDLPGPTGSDTSSGSNNDDESDDNDACYDGCAAQAAVLAASAVATYMAALAVCAAAGPFAIFCWAGATATYAIALYEMDAVVDRCVANCGG